MQGIAGICFESQLPPGPSNSVFVSVPDCTRYLFLMKSRQFLGSNTSCVTGGCPGVSTLNIIKQGLNRHALWFLFLVIL